MDRGELMRRKEVFIILLQEPAEAVAGTAVAGWSPSLPGRRWWRGSSLVTGWIRLRLQGETPATVILIVEVGELAAVALQQWIHTGFAANNLTIGGSGGTDRTTAINPVVDINGNVTINGGSELKAPPSAFLLS
jgi:hypothetical protein